MAPKQSLQREFGVRALVPIKTESGISKKVKEGLILIGETKQTLSLGINPDEFDLEEIVVRTFPGVLVIIGDALPTVYIHRPANDMRFYADNKMLFARYDCNFHHWVIHAPWLIYWDW
jgi:hypothetical protein